MSSSMRRMRHSAETISSTSMNSTWSTGRKRARWLLRRLSNSRRSSQARTTVCAVAPCLTAFWLEAALPCSVRGPVEDSEFCRLARICAGVDMRGPPLRLHHIEGGPNFRGWRAAVVWRFPPCFVPFTKQRREFSGAVNASWPGPQTKDESGRERFMMRFSRGRDQEAGLRLAVEPAMLFQGIERGADYRVHGHFHFVAFGYAETLVEDFGAQAALKPFALLKPFPNRRIDIALAGVELEAIEDFGSDLEIVTDLVSAQILGREIGDHSAGVERDAQA